MFSPLAYPAGIMFFDLSTHMPPPSHLALWPFDLHREPLAIIAIADGVELSRHALNPASKSGPSPLEQNLRLLYQQLEGLRDDYPKALVHRVVIFDHDRSDATTMPEGIVAVPPKSECTRTTIKTVMCDLSSALLAEMTSLAKSFEALTHIESPGQPVSSTASMSSLSLSSQSGSGKLAWTDEAGQQHSKRASHAPALARSNSTGGETSSHLSRMSMPLVPFRPASTGPSTSAANRPSTPVKSGLSNPPVTFDDMVSPPRQQVDGRASSDSVRPPTQGEAPLPAWDPPASRVPVQGFGPGSASERLRSKGRGRAAVVIGAMYLQAGRWTDALRELNEAATIARSTNDHLWHGKTLELTLVTVLLMGWAGVEFVVPTSLQPPPTTEKGSNRPSSSSSSTPHIQEVHAAQPRYLQQLQPLIPDLLDRILVMYSRISAENLPTLPLSETTIRFCKLLSAINLAKGKLIKESLDMVVEGKYPATPPISPRLSVTPTREHIVRLALRAFPTYKPEVVTSVDRAMILSGIASVLGPLGARRKQAMVTRELVSVLIAGLVEARTRGAAEVGIHPAAGLIAVGGASAQRTSGLDLEPGDVERGIDGFLASLCATYGVVGYDVAASLHGPLHAAADSVQARVRAHSAARFFGFPEVKLDVLRACINICEALPDLAGLLRFTTDLLRTAGSGVAPGNSRREQAWPTVPREEQVRLVNTVTKTSALAARMGTGPLYGEYWDEFLVRGVFLEPMAKSSRMPISQPAKILCPNNGGSGAVAPGPRNPFIYNPFGHTSVDMDSIHRTLVAGEPAAFRVTVQNPYEVELDIESIRLDAQGVDVDAITDSVVVGPYRTQVLQLWLTPRAAGDLVIVGAMAQVRGCRERSWPTYVGAWTPKLQDKPKQTGVAALSRSMGASPAPTTESLQLTVIPPQPVLVVASTSLPQSAIMVLEGERQSFSITLRNTSASTPVDLLLFSFEDSTQEPLKAALKNRDATTAELYEYELTLTERQALRLKGDGQPAWIAPGAEATVEVELLGRAGLTNAAVRINYGHLGVPRDQVTENFYSRQVSLPLAVTVNASVELARLDVVLPAGPVPQAIWEGVGAGSHHPDADADGDGHCLSVFDLRNGFPALMNVRMCWTPEDSSASNASGTSTSKSHPLEATTTILPGHTKRMLLPVPRVRITNPHASVPSLVPASHQRQFVVSRSVSAEAERASREAFWFREGMLSRISCEWFCGDAGAAQRHGNVDLRAIRLLPRMTDALRVDHVGIRLCIEDAHTHHELGHVKVDEFVRLRIIVSNRTARPLRPLVRVLPVLRHWPAGVALDHVRKFAWSGTLQRVIGEVPAGAEGEMVVGVAALCRGEFAIGVTVEEIVRAEADDVDGGELPPLVGATSGKSRGLWSLRQPFVVIAKD